MKRLLIALSIVSLLLIVQSNPVRAASRTALYRLYNPISNDHFYTSSLDESTAATNQGYVWEGIMGEVELSQTSNNEALFRLYSSSLNNHFYTASSQEMSLATQGGFRLEGVIGYMPKGATSLQVYRLYHPANGDHFYTTDYAERDRAASSGYTIETSLGYLFVQVSSPTPLPTTSIPNGTWGGEHLGMIVDSNSIVLEYDCAHGTMNQPVSVYESGDFGATGNYTQEHGGPVMQDEVLPVYPVTYSGHISGNIMTLIVNRSDTKINIDTFTITYGQTGQVFKCL